MYGHNYSRERDYRYIHVTSSIPVLVFVATRVEVKMKNSQFSLI